MTKPTMRRDGHLRVTITTAHHLSFDDIVSIVAHEFHCLAESWPSSRRQVEDIVKSFLRGHGSDFCDFEGSDHETYWASKLVASLFPAFGAVIPPPLLCLCGHWEEDHSNYGRQRQCLSRTCDCQDYQIDPEGEQKVQVPGKETLANDAE